MFGCFSKSESFEVHSVCLYLVICIHIVRVHSRYTCTEVPLRVPCGSSRLLVSCWDVRWPKKKIQDLAAAKQGVSSFCRSLHLSTSCNTHSITECRRKSNCPEWGVESCRATSMPEWSFFTNPFSPQSPNKLQTKIRFPGSGRHDYVWDKQWNLPPHLTTGLQASWMFKLHRKFKPKITFKNNTPNINSLRYLFSDQKHRRKYRQ